MFVHALCVHLSGFIQVIPCTFVHGIQNNLAQLASLRSKSAIRNICSGRLKVKVTHDGKMIKWSQIELVRAISCTFMHGFQNDWHNSSFEIFV